MSFLVMCPSRERVSAAKEMLESVKQTATGAVDVIFYVDEDDPDRPQYLASLCNVMVGPRIHAAAHQSMIDENPDYDFYLYAADDVRFETPEWDRMVRDKVDPDRACLVGFSDGISPHLHGHAAVTRAWLEATGGKIWKDGMRHHGVDTYIGRIARDLDRFVEMPEIMLRHHRKIGSDNTAKTFQAYKKEDKEVISRMDWRSEKKRHQEMFEGYP